MKKVLCFFLLVFISISFAFSYSEEIVYQGIAWGSSINKVRYQLNDKQYLVSDEHYYGDDYILSGKTVNGKNEIAGNTINYWEAYCKTSNNDTKGKFYKIVFDFDISSGFSSRIGKELDNHNARVIMEDLANKIESLYCEKKEIIGYMSHLDAYGNYVWYGLNNTKIVLYRYTDSDEKLHLQLAYIKEIQSTNSTNVMDVSGL